MPPKAKDQSLNTSQAQLATSKGPVGVKPMASSKGFAVSSSIAAKEKPTSVPKYKIAQPGGTNTNHTYQQQMMSQQAYAAAQAKVQQQALI